MDQEVSVDESPEQQENEHLDESTSQEERFSFSLSKSMTRKLVEKAEEEGVSTQDLARELLAEGLVLRAFEIAERKQAMRSPHGINSNQGGYANNKGGNRPRNSRGNTSQGNNRRSSGNNKRNNNYRKILDDSASFIEYVRSQEKRG